MEAELCPSCQKPLTIENIQQVVTYLCENNCEMRNLPRKYLVVDYRFNALPLGPGELRQLLKIAASTQRFLHVQ